MANASRNFVNCALNRGKASDCHFHGTLEQTQRAARSGSRVGGPSCYRLTQVTDLSNRSAKSLAAGNHYGVYVRGCRENLDTFKTRAKALSYMERTNASLGFAGCSLYLMTPVSAG